MIKKLAFYLLPAWGFLIGIALYISQKSQKPLNIIGKNIILISIDTLRADHLGLYGYHRNTSPNIDRLGRQSVVFEQAFSAAGYSLGSYTSLFTGVYPKTHNVSINYNKDSSKYKKTKLSSHIKTLAEFLSLNGYHTLWLVSPNKEQLKVNDSEGRGFKTSLPNLEYGLLEFKNWISKNSGKLFFAFFHSNYVHDPYVNKSFKKFTSSNYKGNILSTEKELFALYNKKYKKPYSPSSFNYNNLMVLWWELVNKNSSQDIQRLKDMYDDMILYIDQYIGELLQILTVGNLLGNTVIIFISDHGEAFGEHGHFRHGRVYKEDLHVPLLINIPGIPAKRIKSPVSLIDVYPTLLDLLQKKTPHKMEGLSLKPLITGKDRQLHDFIFGQGYNMKDISVNNGEWKLIRLHNGKRELYHIRKDPEEKIEISPLEQPGIYKFLDHQIDIFLNK